MLSKLLEKKINNKNSFECFSNVFQMTETKFFLNLLLLLNEKYFNISSQQKIYKNNYQFKKSFSK